MAVEKVYNESVEIQTEGATIHSLRESRGKFSVLLGAGASVEAGVPLANEICRDIRDRLLRTVSVTDADEWAEANLEWNDDKRRYSTCLRRYGGAALRVEYFRQMLRGPQASFSHYAISLLMAHDVLKRTALTTNFDKLLERAFVQCGEMECQPIRTPEEGDFWGQEDDKCYLLKLHGDYDTHNILNTRQETAAVDEFHLQIASKLLRPGGLLVLGSAGHEASIFQFVRDLLTAPGAGVLSFGIHWGVYIGPSKPGPLTEEESNRLVRAALERGTVSREIVELFDRRNTCSFFPIWGCGNFLLEYIESIGDTKLSKSAALYLDHETRLRNVFRKQGLSPEAVESHLASLDSQRRSIAARQATEKLRPEAVWRAVDADSGVEIRILYGDISNRSAMGAEEFEGMYRAVVSPEDTAVSAGGGVAYALLEKAGKFGLLNELAKHSPIDHCEVAVTSGGQLPVHYIFHAAAIRIQTDGTYIVEPEHVRATVRRVIAHTAGLGVRVVWVPLLAAGVGPLSPAQSLSAIVEEVAAWGGQGETTVFNIIIYRESVLSREKALGVLQDCVGASYVVNTDS